jgi:hypothetical protein
MIYPDLPLNVFTFGYLSPDAQFLSSLNQKIVDRCIKTFDNMGSTF